ncbi:MAG: hypothetical protein [Cressdnaviricota sp.]|nr:MAG: hypothetical protein [Cressdnaviricota sp.]
MQRETFSQMSQVPPTDLSCPSSWLPKDSTGSGPFLYPLAGSPPPQRNNSPMDAAGFEDNVKRAKEVLTTFKYASPSQESSDSAGSPLASRGTGSSHGLVQLETTSGRRKRVLTGLSLSMAPWQFAETSLLTGSWFGPTQCSEILMTSRPTFSFVVTTPCAESARTISLLLRSNALVKSSGVLLEQARVDWPGRKPHYRLT